MFDWEAEELANIWGKAGEKEYHIVPYPDETYEKTPRPCGDQSKVSDHKVANSTKSDLQHSDEKGQLDNGSQIEERGTSNFVDDNWAHVGSFDDLDRILSNNEYRNENMLSIDCADVETKAEFLKDVNTNLEKMEFIGGEKEKSASNMVRRSPPYLHPVGAVNVAMSGEVTSGMMDTEGQKDDPLFCLGNQQHIKISSSKSRNHETESSPYKHFNYPLLSPCGSNITANQQLTSGSFSLMPVSMTPQEKIEKLRRRQQMRTLLAIRKQQQEFKQISSLTSCSNESQINESLMMNTSSLEDSIVHQLENVISTLGIQLRLCIRDSLFRLSQSALQRQNEPNDRLGTSNSSADGETKTNPIDRVVAHLLFHRPPELSLQLFDSRSSDSRVETSRGFSFFKDFQG